MKKIIVCVLPILLFGALPAFTQQNETPKSEKDQIVIIKKSVDAEGNEVTEKIIKEVEDGEAVMLEWDEKEKKLLEINLEELEQELKDMEIWIEEEFGPAFEERMRKLELRIEEEWGPKMKEELKRFEDELEEWGRNRRIIIRKKKKTRVL